MSSEFTIASPRLEHPPRLAAPNWLLPLLVAGFLLLTILLIQPAAPFTAGQQTVAPLVFVSIPEAGAAASYHALGAGGTITFVENGLRFELPAASAAPVQLTFAGANPDTTLALESALNTRVNQYAGSDPALWQQNLPAYGAISYQQLYPGVDLRYEGQAGRLKGTFMVAAGADPGQIAWRYAGVDGMAVDATTGALQLALPDGSQLIEQAPTAWQVQNGRRVAVPAAFALAAGRITFQLGAYDPALPLVIDPTIIYQTSYNAGALDSGQEIVADAAGNAYVAGYVYPDFFMLKLDPAGNVVHVAFISGSDLDYSTDLAYHDGFVYATGRTLSDDFPVLNAMQPTLNGNADAFLVKLAAADLTLAQSTFLGGSRGEEGGGIAVDDSGNIYLSGATDSTDYYTVAAIQNQLNLTNCFCDDAFVTVLTPDGLGISFSTYLGGAFTDFGQTIAVDGTGRIYLAGTTQSADFPLQNPVQATYGGGYNDTFVARISLTPSVLDYSTFLGGSNYDWQRGLAVDADGSAFVVGATRSTNFPTTAGAFQPDYSGAVLGCGAPPFDLHNCEDIYLSKLAADGQSFVYSTYLGGSGEEWGNDIALDSHGMPYIVGYTYSSDYPGGSSTPGYILISILNQDGSHLMQTNVLDSATPGAGHGIFIDADDNYYVTGAVNAPADVCVVKFAAESMPMADLAVNLDASAQVVTVGQPVTYTVTISNTGPLTATNSLLTFNLPPELGFQSVDSSQGSCSQAFGEVNCDLGQLLTGPTATVTVVASGKLMGSAAVMTEISSDLVDPNLDDNSAMMPVIIVAEYQVSLPVMRTAP